MSTKDLRLTCQPHHFSLDSILALETPIICETVKRIPKFGFLVPEYLSDDIPVGATFQLPLWAANVISHTFDSARSYISVTLGSEFKKDQWESMETSIFNIDLKTFQPRYFEVGLLCTTFFQRNTGVMAELLPEILQHRILCIAVAVLPHRDLTWVTSRHTCKPFPVDFMDTLEQSLFQNANKNTTDLFQWMEIGPLQNFASYKEKEQEPRLEL